MITDFPKLTRRIGAGVLFLCLSTAAGVYAQEADEIIDAVVATTEPTTIQRIDSPDGSMVAEVIVYPCVDVGDEQVVSYERLDLTDTETGETHRISHQVINCGGLGAYGLSIQRWSENGEFLYYTDSREGVPDGLNVDWVPFLWRARMEDFRIESLGQARFSPDGDWLASWKQGQILVISVNSDDATDFALLPANMQIASVVWLPDSSGLLYVQADALFETARTAVTHLDIEHMEQTVLLESGSEEEQS